MSYAVLITDTTTDEIQKHTEKLSVWDEANEYMWEEGNYACDCNRGLFFARAKGVPEDEVGVECGITRFRVVIKVGDTVVYNEHE